MLLFSPPPLMQMFLNFSKCFLYSYYFASGITGYDQSAFKRPYFRDQSSYHHPSNDYNQPPTHYSPHDYLLNDYNQPSPNQYSPKNYPTNDYHQSHPNYSPQNYPSYDYHRPSPNHPHDYDDYYHNEYPTNPHVEQPILDQVKQKTIEDPGLDSIGMPKDGKNHPCYRECEPGEKKACYYRFHVEWYHAMSKVTLQYITLCTTKYFYNSSFFGMMM